MRVSFEVNKSDLKSQIEQVKKDIENEARDLLENIADDAVRFSIPFVDTGAYITSFGFIVGAGRPRGKSSHRKPRKISPTAAGAEASYNLARDISRVDLYNTTSIDLYNGAPHAYLVETKHNHRVFERLEIKYG